MMFTVKCIESLTIICVVNGAFALLSDIIIFILPLPAVANLTLPPKKKFGLSVIFLSGPLAIAASAIAVYYRSLSWLHFGSDEANNVGEFLGPYVSLNSSPKLLV